jgi:hypothetical protein
MSARYRCQACGNLTRFDVTVTRRTREYHHFSVGGELEIEDRELLAEEIEEVSCRWCGASGDAIATVPPVDGVLEGDVLEDEVLLGERVGES